MIPGSGSWFTAGGKQKKTFLVENFVNHDEYYFIKRDRSVFPKNGRVLNYDTFIELLKRDLSDGKTVVVDEFHRLGDEFFDFIHYTKKEGKLILISSTLFLSRELIAGHSPLPGLFAEVPIGIISLDDCIKSLNKFNKKDMVELAVLLREPIAVGYLNDMGSSREKIKDVLSYSILTVPALIGEIFSEEKRTLSAIYEGILRAVASGKENSGEISSYLFSRKLIKKDDPSGIQQYLNNLRRFGIIKKIPVYQKNKFVYKLVSPLMKLFYYGDEKYNLSERKAADAELLELINELLPKIIEDEIREFLADKFGLIESVAHGRDYDIDACLLKFKKPEIVVEVKWKSVRARDITNANKNLEKINAPEKMLFVPDKKEVQSKNLGEIKPVDISDFVNDGQFN